jgi:hypothetical protein
MPPLQPWPKTGFVGHFRFGMCKCPCGGLKTLNHGDALVNATSVGMVPRQDDSPVPAVFLKPFRVVMDIVYALLQTRLLREAQQAGCRTVSGLEMLLYQSVAQFELWTGLTAPVEVMRTALRPGRERQKQSRQGRRQRLREQTFTSHNYLSQHQVLNF